MASASKSLVRDPDLIFVDRYTEINEYLLKESERKEEERKQKIREEQRQQRLFLDEQLRLQREAADRIKADEQKYVEFERERRDRWNEIDAAKRREMKEKEAAQRIAREAQVREVQARKAAAKQAADEADKARMQRIREELRQQRIEALTRRYEEAENMRKVVEQNERNLEMAAEIRHRQFLEGQKVGIEYKKILDRQERDREEQLAATYSRMAKQAVHANFLHNQIATEGARDEARALERQRRDAEARDAELAMRDETRKALQAECNRVLALQVAERKKAAVRTQREEAAIVQLEAKFNADAAAKDEEEKAKRASFVKRYHSSLSDQIKSDRVRRQMIGYTLPLAETQINAELLAKIEAAGVQDRRAAAAASQRERQAAMGGSASSAKLKMKTTSLSGTM